MNPDLFDAFSKRPTITNYLSSPIWRVYEADVGDLGEHWEVDSAFESDFLVFNTEGGRSNFALNSDRVSSAVWPKLSWSYHPAGTHIRENGVEPVAAPLVIEFSKGLTALSRDHSGQTGAEHRSLVGSVDPRTTWVFGQIATQLSRSENNAKSDKLFFEGLVLLVAGVVLEHLGRTEPRGDIRLSPSHLESVTDLVEQSLDLNFSTEDLAALADMPASAFLRAFSVTTGQTPYRFVLSRRIARAQELLAVGTMPIAEIAYACGFASQSHMTDVFRQKLGVTPGRYRKEVRG